jgi:hypothetical protein
MNHRYKVFVGRHACKGGSLQVNHVEKLPSKLFETQPFDPTKMHGTQVINANKDTTWASAGGSIDHVDFSYNKHKGRKQKNGNVQLKI